MKNLKHTRFAHYQLIAFALFSIIVAVLFDSSIKNDNLAFVYVAIVFYALMSASLVIEAFYYKKRRPLGRITITIIIFLLALLMFNSDAFPSDTAREMTSFELGGFVFLLGIWVIFLMSVFTNFILIRAYRREGEVDPVSGISGVVNPPLKGYLPVGFFLKKHLIVFFISIAALIILPSFLFYYIQFVVFDNLLVNVIILFFVLFTSLIVLVILYSRFTNAPFKRFEKDLDFPKVVEVIDKYRANPKLHPETSNYLLLVKANYMSNYDAELATSLWESVVVPLNPSYRLMYDLVKIERLTTKLELEEANNYILEALNTNKQANAKAELNRRLKSNKALREGTTESEVEILWPLNGKVKLLVIHNLALRTLYYHLRGNTASAESYFARLKDMSPESVGIIKTLETILKTSKTLPSDQLLETE